MCDNSRECSEAAARGFGTPPLTRDADGQPLGASGAWAIRPVRPDEFDRMVDIINSAAGVYRGVIPEDCWHDPYMLEDQLRGEIDAGVRFVGYAVDAGLVGVMGAQDVGGVTLIRHAYVRPDAQRGGIGRRLLRHLIASTDRPVLVGTWADADWAVAFYEKNGFELAEREEKNRLLRKYWDIPERQVETSVVLGLRT